MPKLCATDYDGDGRLDLLVGDYLAVYQPEQRDDLDKRLEELNEQRLDEGD